MHRTTPYTKDELIAVGVELAQQLGRWPHSREISESGARRLFGRVSTYLSEVRRAYVEAHGVPEWMLGASVAPVAGDAAEPARVIPKPIPAVQVPEPPVVLAPRPANLREDVTVILPDIHFPYEDKDCMSVVAQAIAHFRPARVVQLGDMLDCAAFSAHDGKTLDEMRGYDFEGMELEPARAFVRECLKHCGEFVYIQGNHEYRVERWLLRNPTPLAANAAWGSMRIEHLFNNVELGVAADRISFLPYQPAQKDAAHGYAVTPDSIAVHSWSIATHAAAQHLRIAKTMSVHFGDTHRRDNATTRDPFTGRIIEANSYGCLCKLIPLYATNGKPTEWVNGFGVLFQSDVDPMDWELSKPKIVNGRAILDGGLKISA